MNSLFGRSKRNLAMRTAAAGLTLAALAGAVTEQYFGKLADSTRVSLYTLKSPALEVRVTNYGARVVSLRVPDRAGTMADVVTGFDTLDGYIADKAYFGAIAGRYANRIANGMFSLNGRTYNLAKNNGGNSLHGGLRGFDKRVWKGQIKGDALVLEYLSKDEEEGYPGNLRVTVTYTVREGDLRIEYTAATDQTTVLNLTSHSYFNLAGPVDHDILDHEITIAADAFTPVDKGQIPTGELRSVQGTAFDFRTPHRIGERIAADDDQLHIGGGYDHNYVLNARKGQPPTLAARVKEPSGGRVMEVWTTEPGLQFYTGNGLDGSVKGRSGIAYKRHYAFCLETQHYPDSPNHREFPTTVLRPGQDFHSTTIYRFSAN
jgi:aldose 1-epimerase